MTVFLLDHLWQSTAILAAVGVLTLFFRSNGALVRHALWVAASLKFLLPFALLNGLGFYFAGLLGLALPQPRVFEALYDAGQPFSDGPAFVALPAPGAAVWWIMLGIWLVGAILVLVLWFTSWRNLRHAVRVADDTGIVAPMPVKTSATQREPGLVGIFRPVLLLPEGISARLTPAELASVIAHEACHMHRHDNLLAALHMLVQAIFWFWPPVWWLGARLMSERERACDEAVVASGNDPEVYAESILKICKFYVQSPWACAAGVSGGDLKQRVEEIMKSKVIAHLDLSRKTLLAGGAAALVLTPLAAGMMASSVGPAAAQVCQAATVAGTHTRPPYPAAAARANETGIVKLQVQVAPEGGVADLFIAESSGHPRLDNAAVEHVRNRWRWHPNNCGTAAQIPVRIVFAMLNGRLLTLEVP